MNASTSQNGRATDDLIITVPHATEAEESVLGSILIDPDAIAVVNGFLRASDFYHPKNRDIYAAMLAVAERGIPTDFVLIAEELERTDKYTSIGGEPYLAYVLTVVPTSVHVEHYARIVQRTATMRRLIQAAGKIAAIGYEDTDDVDRALAQAYAELTTVEQGATTGEFVHIRPLIDDYLDGIGAGTGSGTSNAIPTGFIDIDRLLGGLQRTDLVILAARPSAGKSALGLSIARNAAIRFNKTVAVFSLEMGGSQVAQRFLSMESGVDSMRVREGRLNPTEIRRLGDAVNTLVVAPIYIDDTPQLTIADLRSRARRLHTMVPLDLIIVDYLQFLSGTRKNDNRVQEVGEISRGLKALARDLDVPVLALAQLSRAVDQRGSHVPHLSDLRESGNIEADADVVLFIYREDMYDRDSEKKGIAEIHVAKHRNGATGICSLLFLDREVRFVDLAQPGLMP